ncbi:MULTISPECIES: substrate-binding periplasmic protein [unclassified Haematospirillum]|uniref:substrate-binding periplasmic protein n=1 Tax=unclassified Haematospirillum TaxID=2622088 RepID=UPI00143BD04F|nr:MULTISPECIES: transporter substrate-binding domain-containing protein [unclassified Haematospirillum]NKD55712.1 transporter substrate-binding domain-containing protein [Haematospirillum sp. H4890]NKD75237.1 transporter substrate-binding domain-containing protein [Haematospirillum sp. H4485]
MTLFRALRALLLAYAILPAPYAMAEGLPVVTGDYPPYSGQTLPGGGISTQLVMAAFKAANMAEPEILWESWKRGYERSKGGEIAATFPYAKDDEREQHFLFTDPLHIDQVSFFTRSLDIDAVNGSWASMKICIPQGWIVETYREIMDTFSLTLQQPASMEHCMKMLQGKRVDLVPCATIVGIYEIKQAFGSTEGFTASPHHRRENRTYLMISRAWPDADKLVESFNMGLKSIRESGEYARITKEYTLKSP